jgi:hypothetical protein
MDALIAPKVNPDAEERALQAELDATPLCAAVLAAFTGAVGRRWTVGELERRLSALGFKASRARVTAALAQLEAHLAANAFLPWALAERGKEWFLLPKSVVLAAVENAPGLPAGPPLSDEEKAVLLVVVGHRRKGGVAKTRIREILPVEVEPILESLRRAGLIYADPERRWQFWRARPAALLALGLRSHTELRELRELELYFESGRAEARDQALENAASAARVRRRRRLEQALTRPAPAV